MQWDCWEVFSKRAGQEETVMTCALRVQGTPDDNIPNTGVNAISSQLAFYLG